MKRRREIAATFAITFVIITAIFSTLRNGKSSFSFCDATRWTFEQTQLTWIESLDADREAGGLIYSLHPAFDIIIRSWIKRKVEIAVYILVCTCYRLQCCLHAFPRRDQVTKLNNNNIGVRLRQKRRLRQSRDWICGMGGLICLICSLVNKFMMWKVMETGLQHFR